MRTIEADDVWARFDELLGNVENGETIVITRDAQSVARLTPIDDERAGVAAAIEDLRRYRREKRPTLGGISVRELIEEGRE
jgi:antitoxin (DNA-binding transcriptional repressor) of toxin-antitoxin stability system